MFKLTFPFQIKVRNKFKHKKQKNIKYFLYINNFCVKEVTKHTCCRIDENSGWLAAITALNIFGRIPSCF
jgi:hypothetical protein